MNNNLSEKRMALRNVAIDILKRYCIDFDEIIGLTLSCTDPSSRSVMFKLGIPPEEDHSEALDLSALKRPYGYDNNETLDLVKEINSRTLLLNIIEKIIQIKVEEERRERLSEAEILVEDFLKN